MGGFLGVGNSSAKTDRGNQLAGISADWNVYNRGLPAYDKGSAAGTQNENSGAGALDTAKQYWQGITSGNRTAVAGAAAPVADATAQAGAAQRREIASTGTARGGGINSRMQDSKTREESQVNSAVAAQQPKAAEELGQVGQAQANVGHQQMAEALQALGLSADVAKEIIDSSIQSRPISMAANKSVVQQWSGALSALGL